MSHAAAAGAVLALLLAALPMAAARAADSPGAAGPATVAVGSKTFTENVVLGELIAQLARSAGAVATHRRDLGGTQVLWSALQRGDVDVYPDYTGTIRVELLGLPPGATGAELRAQLASRGVRMSRPLGFNNTYAIGMRRERAEALGIERISQLSAFPSLRFGLTSEFMDRKDGWPGLSRAYGLQAADARGLDHDLAYRGLAGGSLDVTDLYSTDADIRYYGLRVLEDDLAYFPVYDAVLLYRADLQARAPAVVRALLRLEGAISETEMVRMNARAKLERVPEAAVAADFASALLGVEVEARLETPVAALVRNTREHLALVGLSLGAAIVLAIPLGVAAARYAALGQVILSVSGVIQTIPALALLVFMIPPLGIGAPPAIAALFLYSLLPIIRNTHAGLHGIPDTLRESAEALGLPPAARLRRIELPMASPSILAGVKTSAVINIGTATLGALIGAGGYGQPILTGIRLDDTGLILQGAVPAALLALVVQGAFELAERRLVPSGLRISRSDP